MAAQSNKKSSITKQPCAPVLKMKCPHLAVFSARRASGKSYLARYLLYKLTQAKEFDYVYCVSPTNFNGFWPSVLGEENCTSEFNAEWLEALLAKQASLVTIGKPLRGLLILDDCLGSTSFHQDVFTKVSVAGRHYQLSVWAMFQHFHKIPTVIRSNSDYFIVLGNQQDKVMKALYEEFAPVALNNWNQMRTIIKNGTNDYGAVLIDNLNAGKIHLLKAPAGCDAIKIRMPTKSTPKMSRSSKRN
jgi:hypothetical protein